MAAEKIAKDLESILNKLDESSLADLPQEELLELRKELNPYGRTIEGSNNYLTFSFTNFQEEYIKKLLTTSIISFLNRMCDEWHVPNGIPVIPVYEYLKDHSKIESFAKDWTLTDKTREDIESNKKWMEKRVVVKEFLEEMFQFNPDKHIRSAYKPQPKDNERPVIDTPAANLAISKLKKKDAQFREQMLEFDRLQKLVNMSEGASADTANIVAPESARKLVPPQYHYSTMDFSKWSDEDKNALRTACTMIPPVDIFGRFKNYMDNNYDKLREATQYLYCDKPDFDIAINPYSWHSSREDAEAFQKKHRNDVIADIFIADSGKWNLVAPFEKVRSTMKYFNDNTIVLEEMAKQIEKDARLGEDLMKNRVRIEKKKNIEREGPDADFFTKWKNTNTTLKEMGAIDVNKDSFAELDDEDDAIQVDVIHFKEGGLKTDKSHFFTKAEAPNIGK